MSRPVPKERSETSSLLDLYDQLLGDRTTRASRVAFAAVDLQAAAEELARLVWASPEEQADPAARAAVAVERLQATLGRDFGRAKARRLYRLCYELEQLLARKGFLTAERTVSWLRGLGGQLLLHDPPLPPSKR